MRCEKIKKHLVYKLKGKVAENVNLKDKNGDEFKVYWNLNNKIILVFYPKDYSPVFILHH